VRVTIFTLLAARGIYVSQLKLSCRQIADDVPRVALALTQARAVKGAVSR
jgi:hypothetical protein